MTKPTAVTESQHLHPQGHFTMNRVGAMGKGGCHLGTPYCFSGVGITHKSNLDLLESMAHTLSGLIGPWILGGDWNCTPQELEETGWVRRVGGVIHAPEAATCNGKTYDFFVVANCIAEQVVGTLIMKALVAPGLGSFLVGTGPRVDCQHGVLQG